MLQNWWRRLVKQPFRAGRRARPPSPGRKRSRPLALEYLEDRVVPSVVIETEPNNSIAEANLVTIGSGDVLLVAGTDWLEVNGMISGATDVDYYRFTLTARSGVFFDIDARETGSTLDSILTVFDSSGAVLRMNDNGYDFDTGWPASAVPTTEASSTSADSALYLDLDPGTYPATYYVRVSSSGSTTGAYQLRLLADPNYSASVPVFNSRSGAADCLYLDFDGHAAATDAWGAYSVAAYNLLGGNPLEFSPAERLAIQQVWRVVAEDFIPFAINVTTSYSGPFDNGVAHRQVITSNDESYSPPIVGIAILNSYSSGGASNNVAFTFAGNFSAYLDPSFGDSSSGHIMAAPVEIGNTSSHEFGHTLGLRDYTALAQVNTIMFASTGGLSRETWTTGTNDIGDPQDDMAIISSPTNTFGYNPDDFGNGLGNFGVLNPNGGLYTTSGVIGQLLDIDFFRFTASGLTTITVNVDDYVRRQPRRRAAALQCQRHPPPDSRSVQLLRRLAHADAGRRHVLPRCAQRRPAGRSGAVQHPYRHHRSPGAPLVLDPGQRRPGVQRDAGLGLPQQHAIRLLPGAAGRRPLHRRGGRQPDGYLDLHEPAGGHVPGQRHLE